VVGVVGGDEEVVVGGGVGRGKDSVEEANRKEDEMDGESEDEGE
jgi:hypothetical protein